MSKSKTAKKTPVGPAGAEEAPKSRFGQLFATTRQILLFVFFLLWCAIDVSLLGLVSEQIHKHGNNSYDYPKQTYYHALGLGLFSSIFFLVVGLTHWWFSHAPLMFLMLAAGVFFGTTAGILTLTPFGQSLRCGNPVESFPPNYQPFVGDCSRITAIVGLSWAMFALAVVGLFWFFADKYSCVSKRDHLYAPYVGPAKAEKHPLHKGKHNVMDEEAAEESV